MLSETLAAGLESYEIGPKIRALRLKKNLGLVQLGEHTGMSSGMLSKIERGQLFPTLPTLLKIAMVFGVGLEHFFVDLKDRPTLAVVRKKDRLRLPDRPDAENPLLFLREPRLPCQRPEDGGLLYGVRTALGSDGAPQTFRRRDYLRDQWSACRERRR